MSCGTAARLGLAHHHDHHNNRTASFIYIFFRNKRRRHQPQPQHNSRRRTAAAAAAVAAATAVRRGWRWRGWRWRWRLRRRRCGIPTVVDQISIVYDITPQQRTRPHRRERGSAGALAPTPEVARTRHASPATLCASASRLGCVYRCQAQRTASSVCFVLPCGLCPRVL